MLNFGLVGSIDRALELANDLSAMGVHLQGVWDTIPITDIEGVLIYSSYETMLADKNIDAIIIVNFFHDHCKYAIQALEAGKNVLSETTAAVTLGDCVKLCEAVEKSGKVYQLFENYAYKPGVLSLKGFADGKYLGKLLFAEGEYCHPLSVNTVKTQSRNLENHWRRIRPCTFYATHALAPLLYVTKASPKTVQTMVGCGTDKFAQDRKYAYNEECGIMSIETTEGVLLKVSGTTHYAGRSIQYKLLGENGGAEILRGNSGILSTYFNSNNIPKGLLASQKSNVPEYSKLIVTDVSQFSHAGEDYFPLKEFICAIQGIQPSFFDVYKACQMSAIEILGWYSALNGGVKLPIPDFHSLEDREAIKDDFRSPFAEPTDENYIPCTSKGYVLTDEVTK